MTQEDAESQLAEELASMSLKLVNAVQKQLDLEETVHNLNRNLIQMKARNAELTKYEAEYKVLAPENERLTTELLESRASQKDVKAENARLSTEVEDLSASLFVKANEMVSDANRETHNFKVKNRQLYEEMEEKDMIISSLQSQLTDLKSMMNDMEDKEKSRNSFVHHPTSNIIDDNPLNQSIYSPTIKLVRLDLNNYNHDFKSFIYAIIKPDFIFELSYLKNYRFFKKIWLSEIETSLSSVPAISQNTLFKNFQRGKTFWSSIVEGRAVIEPIKGTNESFKLSYKGEIHPGDAPTAIEDPCSICGECRNDNLEHSRLYYFKLLHDVDSGDVLASFPLCNYCVIMLRNICDFFAKLRLIRKNIYKLAPNSSFDEFNTTTNTQFSQFKRNPNLGVHDNSSNSNLVNSNKKRVSLDPTEEAKLIKIYISLILIRNKLFWSKIGNWDNYEEIKELNIDEMKLQTFITYAESMEPEADFKSIPSDNENSVITTEVSPKESSIVDTEMVRRKSQVEAADLKAKEMENLKPEIGQDNLQKEAEEDRIQQENLFQQAEEDDRLQQERLLQEKLQQEENERIHQEKLSQQAEDERLEQERLHQEQLQKEAAETERIQQEQIQHEKLSQQAEGERLEQERLAQEKLEQEAAAEEERIQQEKSQQADIETKTKAQAAVLKAKEKLEKAQLQQQQQAEKRELEKIERQKKAQEKAKRREELKAKLDKEYGRDEPAKANNTRQLKTGTNLRVSEMIKKVESKDNAGSAKTEVDDDDEDDFQDANDSTDNDVTKLSRKNSTSKQFSQKLNQNLDETLKLIEESIDGSPKK